MEGITTYAHWGSSKEGGGGGGGGFKGYLHSGISKEITTYLH